MLRLSTLLLAAAAFLPAVVSARRVHSAVAAVAAPAVNDVAPASDLDFNVKCAAACAAKAALCFASCKKGTLNEESLVGESDSLSLTCHESCALKAAGCAAGCILAPTPNTDVSLPAAHTDDIIDASNIDAVFHEMAAAEVERALLATQFEAFKTQFNKKYESPEHEAHRFELFQANMKRAAELNKLNPEAKFGVTQFSDLHPTEFKRQYLTFRPAVGDAALLRHAPLTQVPAKMANASVPTNWDWRKPADTRPVGVTAVKDQGQCGSCWAFSATEEVESSWILAGKPVEILSPEQTVDCDTVDGGCNGGDTVSAYAYIKKAGGIMDEQSYPYHAGNTGSGGRCKFVKSDVKASITGFTYATPGCEDSCTSQNEDLLRTNLYKVGPVSICVDAEPWQTYQSGILGPNAGCQKGYDELDHCVQLVGYGVDPSGVAFWSVRNSWATSWGENGYIRLKYGSNTCGVADEATIATVA